MSPLKRKKLNKIRSELDKLDNSLIKLIKKRTNLVNQVLKLKEYEIQYQLIFQENDVPTPTKKLFKSNFKSKIYKR